MPFARPTLNELIIRIENDIVSRLTGTVPLLQRALLKILARVLAGAFDTVYGFQEFISINMIIDLAEGDFLRRWAFQWRVEIQEATFGTGNVIFTGVDTTLIPVDTLLVRSDGIEYTTTAAGTIVSGSATVPIQCTTAGTIGNAVTGTILTLSSPIVDINDNVTLTGSGVENGVEGDTDEIIRQNLLNRIQNPPMGGSESDFKAIAEGVAGVDKAFPFENQATLATVLGSVTTVIKKVGVGGDIEPGATLITDVKTALEDPKFKPLTSTIFVNAIVARSVDFTLSIKPDNSTIRDNITKNLNDTFNADAIPGGTILISHIRNAISTGGITDFTIDVITVEGQGSVPIDQDIVFTNFEYPFVQNITFTLLP